MIAVVKNPSFRIATAAALIAAGLIASLSLAGERSTAEERSRKPVVAAKKATAASPDAKSPAPMEGRVTLPGGTFTMGGGERPEENPAHSVTVSPFAIDITEVTVARFGRFIAATKYRTDAEKWGWSGVFDITGQAWTPVNGATWDKVAGPSAPKAAPDDPVTQVSWNDAVAFCAYEKGRLPTEAEWEFASRGGKDKEIYPWGDELRPGGKPAANWWQGTFPAKPRVEDGFKSRAPVARFKPNGYGLYDMIGNVWEWNADWYDPTYYAKSPAVNPRGPTAGKDRVMRGGSWMCSENYCRNFRNAARSSSAPDTGLDNLGFRCAYDVPAKK
jgi:formylglycine-generating enzyme required for sulfatase activity